MKKIIAVMVLAVTAAAAAFAASYNIDERREVSLAGIKTIVFELKQPNCALCVSTGRQSYSLTGGGLNGVMDNVA